MQIGKQIMGILNKDACDEKMSFALKRNIEIAVDAGMTDNQAAAVVWMCAKRHWLHTHSGYDLLKDDGGKLETFICQTYDDDESKHDEEYDVCSEILEVPAFTPVCPEFIPATFDWDDIMNDDERQDYINEAKAKNKFSSEDDEEYRGYLLFRDEIAKECGDMIESVNRQIEEWLGKIDDKFGTTFHIS